jgi:hypothetical protein
MKTYSVIYAEDVPHYATVEIQAASDAEAVAIAKAQHTGDLDFGSPDWGNPILRRIVSIENGNYIGVASDISLDTYQLLVDSKVRDAIQYALECLCAFKPDWLVNKGLNVAVEKLEAARVELGGAA